MPKPDVNVAERIQFETSVPAQRDTTHGHSIDAFRGGARRGENVLENDIDQLGAAGTNFAATAPSLMAQTQPVIFYLEKPLIEREELGRLLFIGGREFARRMRQHFIMMTRHSLGEA